MFERFTERARKVMALANQEAQRFNHEYIGTEHLLLGLVKEGSGVGANVLKNLGLDLAKVRAEVEKLVRPGPDKVTKGRLPSTPRAKKVTEHAIAEARRLNHNYIGTEHLLMGLLCQSEGVAAQVLTGLGLKPDEVREEILRMLAAGAEPEKAPDEGGTKSGKSATHLNVEVKARCSRPENVRKLLKQRENGCKGVDYQTDTHFRCPNGRLKLREGKIETALIHYQRPDLPGPKESFVCLYHPTDPAALKETLTRACGVLVTVRKKREIYHIDNVKFHIDDVEDLGGFLEIEAIDADGTIGIEKLRRQCEQYMELLGVGEADLIGESYADMLPRGTGL